MTFSKALRLVKEGGKVVRADWSTGTYVALHAPGAKAKLTDPYLYREEGLSKHVYQPTQLDLLAEDWRTATV